MPAARPRIRGDLTVAELDGEAVIYDEENGNLHHLNPTASIVFSLCDGTATAREIAADIATAFHMQLDEVEHQVRTLLSEFRKAGLLDGRTRRSGKNGG